jgi:deazaflavin-dependent oxidoreductase (nitroreductase family)
MDHKIRRALDLGPNTSGPVRTIDITTYGAGTGRARRIEIWLYEVDRHWYLSGRPGRRDWYANLRKNPHLIVHLKHGVRADLPATARLVPGEDERQRILPRIVDDLNAMERRGAPQFDPAEWIADSPLAEIVFNTPPS